MENEYGLYQDFFQDKNILMFFSFKAREKKNQFCR